MDRGVDIPALPRSRGDARHRLNVFGGEIDHISPYTELRSIVHAADFQRILDEIRSEWQSDEYRTFTVTEMLPSGILTACPHNSWHSTGMMTHVPKASHLS